MHGRLAAAALALAGAAALPGGGWAETGAGDLSAAMLATPCLSCHATGAPGAQQTAGIPSLAGLDAAEMTAALERFRAGDPEATVMTRVARGYSAQELAVIAAWLADSGAAAAAGGAE